MNINFTRNSQAYNSDGSIAAANVPRFQAGRNAQDVFIEGTTNLLHKPKTFDSSFWNSITSGVTILDGVANAQNTTSSQWTAHNTLDVVVLPNTQYTISCMAKTNNINSSSKLFFNINQNDSWATFKTFDVKNTDWQLYAFTFTTKNITNIAISIGSYITVQDGYSLFWQLPQLEQKPYATSFVDGTRADKWIYAANRALQIEEGTTNLVSNGSFENDLTSWYARDSAVLSIDTVNKIFGNKSAKVITNSLTATQGIYQNVNVTANTTYTFSTFVKGTGKLRVYLYNIATQTSQNSYITLDGTWQRVSVTNTITNSTTVTVGIVTDGAQTITYYVDGAQLEQKAYATSFTDSTRQPESLTIPATVLNVNQGTIEFYTNITDMTKRQNSGWNGLISIAGTNNGLIMLSHSPSAPGFRFYITPDGVTASYIDIPDSNIPNGWHQFAFKWSATEAKIFVDGQLMGIITNPKLPTAFTTITLGVGFANNFCNTVYDDLRISSIARSDSEIAASYTSSKPLPVDQYTTCKLNFDGDLSYHVPFIPKTKTETTKYIKIFDRNHNILDEINEISSLKYKFTLNGTGTCTFSIPLASKKCIKENFLEFNEVEIWEDSTLLWWGVIVGRDFNGGLLTVNCYDYLFILSRVLEFPYTYANMTIFQIVNNLLMNVSFFRGDNVFTVGSIDNGLLMVDSTPFTDISNTADRLKKFLTKFNYDFEIDSNKKINVYGRKGSIKDFYVFQYGTDADNIINEPRLSFSALNMSNVVRSSGTNAYGTVTNSDSIQLYGKMGEEYNPSSNDISQTDMDNELNAELQRGAYPTVSVSLTSIDSALCPFNDIEIGDTVSVYLKNYWEFKDTLRIIEYEHDVMTGKRSITAGQIIYRPQMPQKKIYVK